MAGEKRSQDQDETARTVLVDIEGTTTSISFVKVKSTKTIRHGQRERVSRTRLRRCRFAYRSIPRTVDSRGFSANGYSASDDGGGDDGDGRPDPRAIPASPGNLSTERLSYIYGRIPRRVIVLASGRCAGSSFRQVAATVAVVFVNRANDWKKKFSSGI